MLVCESSVKPLMLFHLMHAHGVSNALVFTKSAESASRLVRLLEFFEAARVAAGGGHSQIVAHAYSSDLYPSERKTILDRFKSQEIHMCAFFCATARSMHADTPVLSDLCVRI